MRFFICNAEMDDLICFVAVEYPDDENVAGNKYWYICPYRDVKVGDFAIAPLGRHNHTQRGIVREVRFDAEYNSPFPIHIIKSIKEIIKK